MISATSDGSYRGINSASGGLCKTKNRKIQFDVEELESTPMAKPVDVNGNFLPTRRSTEASPVDLSVDGDILPQFWSPKYQFVDRPLADGLQKSRVNGEVQPQLILYEIEEGNELEKMISLA